MLAVGHAELQRTSRRLQRGQQHWRTQYEQQHLSRCHASGLAHSGGPACSCPGAARRSGHTDARLLFYGRWRQFRVPNEDRPQQMRWGKLTCSYMKTKCPQFRGNRLQAGGRRSSGILGFPPRSQQRLACWPSAYPAPHSFFPGAPAHSTALYMSARGGNTNARSRAACLAGCSATSPPARPPSVPCR